MAGIGPDIEDVINELGTTVVVLKSPSNLTEKIAYEADPAASRSFFREYSLDAEFTYNTKIVHGDIIQFDGNSYMVAHQTKETFEDSSVEFLAVIYKSNFPDTALILTPVQSQNPVTFEITQTWSIRTPSFHTRPYGLIYRSNFSSLLDKDATSGKELSVGIECIVPAAYGVQIGDRVQLSSNEFYRIEDIERFIFKGLRLLTLVFDERPAYIPPVTP